MSPPVYLIIRAFVVDVDEIVILLHAEEAEERRVLGDDLPRLVPGHVVLPSPRIDSDSVKHL